MRFFIFLAVAFFLTTSCASKLSPAKQEGRGAASVKQGMNAAYYYGEFLGRIGQVKAMETEQDCKKVIDYIVDMQTLNSLMTKQQMEQTSRLLDAKIFDNKNMTRCFSKDSNAVLKKITYTINGGRELKLNRNGKFTRTLKLGDKIVFKAHVVNSLNGRAADNTEYKWQIDEGSKHIQSETDTLEVDVDQALVDSIMFYVSFNANIPRPDGNSAPVDVTKTFYVSVKSNKEPVAAVDIGKITIDVNGKKAYTLVNDYGYVIAPDIKLGDVVKIDVEAKDPYGKDVTYDFSNYRLPAMKQESTKGHYEFTVTDEIAKGYHYFSIGLSTYNSKVVASGDRRLAYDGDAAYFSFAVLPPAGVTRPKIDSFSVSVNGQNRYVGAGIFLKKGDKVDMTVMATEPQNRPLRYAFFSYINGAIIDSGIIKERKFSFTVTDEIFEASNEFGSENLRVLVDNDDGYSDIVINNWFPADGDANLFLRLYFKE